MRARAGAASIDGTMTTEDARRGTVTRRLAAGSHALARSPEEAPARGSAWSTRGCCTSAAPSRWAAPRRAAAGAGVGVDD